MKGVIQIDVLFVLFCIMFFVYQHGIYAKDVPDIMNNFQSDDIIISKAEFKQSNEHSFGFDDYTNWKVIKKDNYIIDEYCRMPFISIKSGTTGYIRFLMNYNCNIQQSISFVVYDESISTLPTSVSLSPTQTYISSNVSISLNHININKSTYLYANYTNIDVDIPVAVALINGYLQNDINVRIVNVNKNANDTIPTPDFSCLSSQAILKITTDTVTYNVGSLIVNDNNYTIDDNTQWTIQMLKKLSENYYATNVRATSVNYVMFIIKGSIVPDSDLPSDALVFGCREGKNSWVLASKAGGRTPSHELGHCLGLSHRMSDYNALMCPSDLALKHSTDSQSRLLRENEWDIVRGDKKRQ